MLPSLGGRSPPTAKIPTGRTGRDHGRGGLRPQDLQRVKRSGPVATAPLYFTLCGPARAHQQIDIDTLIGANMGGNTINHTTSTKESLTCSNAATKRWVGQ